MTVYQYTILYTRRMSRRRPILIVHVFKKDLLMTVILIPPRLITIDNLTVEETVKKTNFIIACLQRSYLEDRCMKSNCY